MSDLLPCPFCGRAPNMKQVPSQTVSANYWWVGCEIRGNNITRDLVGCGIGHSAWSESDAAAKWNTRTPSDAGVRDGAVAAARDIAAILDVGITEQGIEVMSRIITKHLPPDARAVNGEWMLIETAPTDGTRVMLALENGAVFQGFFGPKYSTYGVNYGDAWGYGRSWKDTFVSKPTHWMPLPAPPLAARTGESVK